MKSKQRPPWWPTKTQKERADRAHREAMAEREADPGDSSPELTIEERLTEEERRRLLERVFAANPQLRGAKVADVLDIYDNGDALLSLTERFYEQHADWLARDDHDPKERHFAVLAAALLQPAEGMLLLVERLLAGDEAEG